MRFKEFLEAKHDPCAGIFFSDGKSVLLVRRAEGKQLHTWCLPGGHARDGETPLETAERESEEEVGSVQGHKIGQINQDWWTCFFYEVSKPFNVKLSGENDNWKWIKFEDISNYNLHSEFKKQYKKYIAFFKSHC